MSATLLERLDRTAARLSAVARWSTVVWTLAIAIGVAGLLALVDWIGRFSDPGLRWVFTATLAAAIVVAATGSWRRLRPAGASRLGVAQRLQALDPKLGSRIASAVQFAESDPDDRGAGSAELRRAVVLDAARGADSLPYDAVIDRGPLRLGLRWLATAIALMLVLAATDATALGRGLWRLAAPWAHAPWPREVTLRVVEAPSVLARGDAFEAVAVNERGPLPDDVRVEYRFRAEGDSPARTDAAAARLVGDKAVATRDDVRRSFAYRFVGGDDDSMAWTLLEVIDPPAAEAYSVRITPPEYTGLSPSDSAGPVRVLAGTRLAIEGTVNKPIESATLQAPGGEPTPLPIDGDRPTQRFRTPAEGWVAAAPEGKPVKGEYEVRLAGESGVTGSVGPHPWEVLPDTPPKVTWTSDEAALATANSVVPISGVARDNLAIERIELLWTDGEAAPTEAEDAEPERVAVQEKGAEPPKRGSLSEEDEAAIDFAWDLQPLEIPEGSVLTLWLAATDYQPATGQTSSPRRLTIVSEEEFLADLAERQSRLLTQVQLALSSQRQASDATRELEADTRTADSVDRAALDRLTSVEFQQREATATVAEPTRGAADTAERLLADLDRSRVEAPDLRRQLDAAGQTLRGLADSTMPAARGELAEARRAATRADEVDAASKQEFGQRLTDAGALQTEAVDQLEQVAELLTSWADYQRFAAEATALEELQRELAAESRRLAAAAAAEGRLAPSPADQEKLLVRQAESSRRFEKLRQAMQRLLEKQPEGSNPTAAADAVGDALAEAEDAGVASRMRDAAREISRGRSGAASNNQTEAAEGLQAMAEALRERTTSDPQELIDRLEKEKDRLAELQKEVDRLAQQPDSRQTDAARRQAANRAARQGRRLGRLTAAQAAASAQQGAQQTAGESSDGRQGDSGRQLQQAQQSFQQAQRQIDDRIEQLQDQQTQKVLRLLAERIDGYIEREKGVLEETIDLDTKLSAADAAGRARVEQAAQRVARDQRELAEELGEFASKLSKRAVFELALGGAQKQGADAAKRLDEARVDKPTQRREASALARLEQIKEVLEQTPQLPEDQQQGGGGQGGQGGEKPPSPIDVAELKMLRLMQMEVLSETDEYEADTATARRTGRPLPEGWRSEGESLAQRQRRLAELALELSERDNDPDDPAP